MFFGLAGDVPVPADYDGDGVVDLAVFRPSTGTWHVRGMGSMSLGRDGDVPVEGQFDGQPGLDLAVFRPSSGTWVVAGREDTSFGLPGDVPAVRRPVLAGS